MVTHIFKSILTRLIYKKKELNFKFNSFKDATNQGFKPFLSTQTVKSLFS